MRNPAIHRLFGIDNQRGLSDYLAGNVMLELITQRSRLQNLTIVPAGRLPGKPADLIAGQRMEDMLRRLAKDYDYVLIDAPPLRKTSEAAVIAPHTDGVLVVVKLGSTPREVAAKAVHGLRKARVRLLGSVATHLAPVIEDYDYHPYN